MEEEDCDEWEKCKDGFTSRVRGRTDNYSYAK